VTKKVFGNFLGLNCQFFKTSASHNRLHNRYWLFK